MEKFDILIIGAGVVGLAIAAELSKKHKEIIVLERHNSFGQETSSRNSEVIHAGIYYPKDSLKAKLCVEGRKLLYEICQQNNIPHKKIGKLIVASEKEEIPTLEELFQRGKGNGVEDLRLIDAADLKKMEPNVSGIAALYSPSTGIIDSHRLMKYFSDIAQDNGAVVSYNSEVVGIKRNVSGYEISVKNDREAISLNAKIVINSAGLDSDSIAEMAGMDIELLGYRLHYCKGQYFRVNSNKKPMISRLVYPIPKPAGGGLGIHATLDLSGSLRLGPDDRYMQGRDKDYSVDDFSKRNFYNSAKRFMPFLKEEELSVDTAGIRPKLNDRGEDFRDFIIQEESSRGLPGLINLVGIESPGLTASLSIARYVEKLLFHNNTE